MHAAAHLLPHPRRRVLLLGLGKRVSSQLEDAFRGHIVSLEDLVPKWYRLDYDTIETTETLAREYVELLVCAQSERFIGNLAAPSTHAVCSLRGRSVRLREGRDAERCEDALGREIHFSRWHFF